MRQPVGAREDQASAAPEPVRRAGAGGRAAANLPRIDPVRLELAKNAIGSVVDEMVLTVVRVAYSPGIKDSMDVSSAFCDRNGAMVAQGLSLPAHLGSMPDAMQAVLGRYGEDFAPGDVVVLNDPFQGGMHLPDIFVIKPVFVNGATLLGFAVVVAHHNDIGGRVAGSSAADSTEIFQEGLRIPVLKLHEGGRMNEALVELIRVNVRTPDTTLGDLEAQLAACRIAEAGMQKLADRWGVAQLERYFMELLDYSEREARRTISLIPDGVYRFEDYLDDDGITDGKPVRIRVTATVAGSELRVDLDGSEPQVAGAINSTLSFTKSAIYFVVRSLMDADVPNNAGFFRPIKVSAPRGCVVNVAPPGACAARGITGFRVVDTTIGALAQAVPGRVRAAGEGGPTTYSISGYHRDGRFFLFREGILGAWGGGDGRDGVDAIANPAVNIRNTPIEIVETQSPIMVEKYALVPDTGGAGEWRGGLSVERQLRFLGERGLLQLRGDRRDHRPFGLLGGAPGAASETRLFDGKEWRPLPSKFTLPIKHGDAIYHRLAGAGGFGDPLSRDERRVLSDVRNGKLSVEAAAEHYGVVVRQKPWRVDQDATAALRNKRSGETSEGLGGRTP